MLWDWQLLKVSYYRIMDGFTDDKVVIVADRAWEYGCSRVLHSSWSMEYLIPMPVVIQLMAGLRWSKNWRWGHDPWETKYIIVLPIQTTSIYTIFLRSGWQDSLK